MTNVIDLASSKPKLLKDFFEFMYGDEEGFVYSPTLEPNTEVFEQYWFHWPTQKQDLINHVLRFTPSLEVYYGPGLFSRAGAEKDDFRGTNFVWAEFDGTLPGRETGTLEPTIKIRSSTEGHEHWYWKLDQFTTDIAVVEDISQRLAYHLGADLGCWNANRVLRPPGTIHHESAQVTSIVRWAPTVSPVDAFKSLPTLPITLIQDNDIGYVPQILDTVMKYAWSQENIEFFKTSTMEIGHRSSALTKLGHICVEMGMTNAEVLSVLTNADDRWGKFRNRRDRKTRLLGIINFCRSRHPAASPGQPEHKPDNLRIFNFIEFSERETVIEWVIRGLIHKKGRALLSGQPGTGKSQLSFRLAEKLARGAKFLNWEVERPMRVLFVSMEMPYEELRYITDQMSIEHSELIKQNLGVMPVGHSIQMTKHIAQAAFAAKIEEFEPDGIIFDSLGIGIGGETDSDKKIIETFDYVKRALCDPFGVFTWFIHHDRKPQIGNKKPNKLEDLFGSTYIGAEITTGINLWTTPTSPNIEVSCLKLRMAERFKTFNIRRQPGLDFEIVDANKMAVTSQPGTPIFGVGTELNDTL